VAAKVLSLTTRVDTERGAVVKELEDATAVARQAPGRVVGCAVAIISLDDDGLAHVHTHTEGRNILLLMGAVQVLCSDLAAGLVYAPGIEPEPPAPAPEEEPHATD
jgi:hypothetical protein